MIDLTPLDVRKKRGDFRRLLRGYDPEEVDTFMDLVAERFEELVRENLSLSEKTGRIESQLEALIGRETAVQEALVTAQKLREDVKDQSQRDAKVVHAQAAREINLLKAEADAEIMRRLGEADGLILERQRALEDLERSRLKFLKSFRGLLERELDAVDVEETRRPLEDVPLELELRGWMPGGEGEDTEEDMEEGYAEGGDAEGGEVDAEEATAILDVGLVEAGDAFHTSDETDPEQEESQGVADVEELDAVHVSHVIDEVDEVDEVDEPDAVEADEGVPGGFETQILSGAMPADLIGSSGGPSYPTGPKTSSSTQEPKWLFSLLKKEEEERGGEG